MARQPRSISRLAGTYGYYLVAVLLFSCAFYIHAHRQDARLSVRLDGTDPHFINGEGVPPLVVAETDSPTRTISILFTGNSIIFVNNLPYMLAKIAEADSGSHLRLEIASDTHGGWSIGKVWRDGKALRLLESRPWSYVVLQEHSWWVGRPDQIAEMQATVPILARAVAATGAKPLLFMTYVKKPGSDWYRTEPEFGDPAYMQRCLDYYTYDVGRRAGIPVIPVGDYWWRLMQADPALNLYNPDGTHPGMAGTYLMALMFYRAVTLRNVADIDYVPPGLSPRDAATIRAFAAR